MLVKKKNNLRRTALLQSILVFMLLGLACGLVLVWAAKSEDSELARSIRHIIGLSDPAPAEIVVEEPPSVPVVEPPVFAPEPLVEPEPAPITEITFREVAARRQLWPKSLTLKLSVQVAIRYNGKDYGFMKFPRGRQLRVNALMPGGEIYCQIDGNHLSLSVYETDFYGWFKQTHGADYKIQPIVVDFVSQATVRHKLGTPKGDAAFWAEMRIWCQQNYDSVLLKVGEDRLIFAWLPKEDVPINFPAEAREIARNYLLKRAKYGGHENYAACEIRHPITGELLGASSIFIPRL